MSRERQKSNKRPFSRSSSSSSSRSRSRSSVQRSDYYTIEGKVTVELLIPDGLVGHLMAQNLKLLERLRRECSPVTIWVRARSARRTETMRTMIVRGESKSQVEDARVKIHDFFHHQLQITVDGVLPSPRVTSPSSRINNNEERNVLMLPSPIPTISVSSSPSEEARPSSSLYQENYSPGLHVSETTIPVHVETDQEFEKVIVMVDGVIKLKFPETEIALRSVSDPDQSNGQIKVISVRGQSNLCVQVAKTVVIMEVKERLGVNLEEPSAEMKELEERLEKSEELVRKHEKEIKNLKIFNKTLDQYRAFYKEKYIRKMKNDSLNEKEFGKMKQKLKTSMNDFDMVVKEKHKLLKEVVDLQNELSEHSEFIQIVKNCQNDKNQEDDQEGVNCPKCPHLLYEMKNLKEKLTVSEGLVSLRNKELKLLKSEKTSRKDSSDSEV